MPNINPYESRFQSECREYLETGPPEHMTNYVPESMTEILIAYGANGKPIDAELAEIASIILMESETLAEIEDPEIRRYMEKGAELVERILVANE